MWDDRCFRGQCCHLTSGGITIISMATKTSGLILYGYDAVSSSCRGVAVTLNMLTACGVIMEQSCSWHEDYLEYIG